MQSNRIIAIKSLGTQKTLDIEVNNKSHIFYGNGIATSNSHSYSYAYIGYITAYLKAHFPLHFYTAYFKHVKDGDELKELLSELSLFNIEVKTPSITNLSSRFTIRDGYIQYGMGELKSIGLNTSKKFIEDLIEVEKEYNKPLSQFSWYEFLILCSPKSDTRSLYNLLSCGFLDNTGVTRSRQLAEYKAFCDLTGKPELDFIQREWRKYDNLIYLISAMLEEHTVKIIKGVENKIYTIKGQRRAKVESILASLTKPGTGWEDTTKWVCEVETELMGTSISRSKTFSLERLGNLKCLDFSLGRGYNDIRIVCEVIGIDERIIKSGPNMGKKFANLKLKDTSGEIECTCFSKEWSELRGDVVLGNVLMVNGKRNQDKTLKIESVEVL